MFFLNRFAVIQCLLLVFSGIVEPARRMLYAATEDNPKSMDCERANLPPGSRVSAGMRAGAPEETTWELEAQAAQAAAPNGESSPDSGPSASTDPPPPVTAPTARPNRLPFFDKVVLSGFADTYYGFNLNRPASQKNGLRNFDINHNRFSLNLLELDLDHQPDPFGFRIDLSFGDTARLVHNAEPGGTGLSECLQQAYASYKIPAGKGLTVDMGKFVTPHGAEVIEGKDNWNYSRSLLFSWAIPYYHFGARIRYPLSDRLSLATYIINGWNNVVDNNGGKTYGVQVAFNPIGKLSIVQNYMAGPEQNRANGDWRHLWDTTITYAISQSLSLMANYDYGMDRLLGSRVRWQGMAGYARLQIWPRLAIAPRIEWFSDPQGFTSGCAQNLHEATFTLEFKLHHSLLMRGEYRQDWSNQPFFEWSDSSLSRSQTTGTLGVIYILGREFR